MRRGVFDVLRRGLDSAVANWPLALIRFLESLVFAGIAIASVFLILVPVLVSIGIHVADFMNPDTVSEVALSLLQKWVVFLWVFVVASFMLLLFVAVHSFVVAGSARVLVDAERIAGPEMAGPRARYGVFSMERWTSGGTDGWWPVFWIYNLAWGVAGILLLLPLIPMLALIVILHETPGAAVAVGCFGMIAFVAFAFVIAVATNIWTTRAVVSWAVRRAGARDALASGWRSIFGDFGRHVLVALAVMVVAMAGSSFFASFSLFASFAESTQQHAIYTVFTLPLRLIGSILSSAFSAAVATWFLASYSSLGVEGHG